VEAEESPLLEAIAREHLVKTHKAGKGLTGAVVICELWRLAISLLITCSSKWCVQVVNKSIH
jgi:hypothetical protein